MTAGHRRKSPEGVQLIQEIYGEAPESYTYSTPANLKHLFQNCSADNIT